MAERSADRRSFGPTVLAGLATAGGAAVAGNRDWVVLRGGEGESAFAASLGAGDLSAPPVTATALVLLASWGVLLVTRGRVRRVVAWLGLATAVATTALAVAAWLTLPGDTAAEVSTLDLDVARTWWGHLGVLAGVLSVVASAAAVRTVGGWPEMGRRYDAPAGRALEPARDLDPEDRQRELWKALDEGRDPTD
ncbi:Trp biosynthesis-associated membrane protein [Nocardioides litoris]|uniref:Trp biosynthesis-associated membrane protein n=1 Tax=Nocardioides litoris TaxID=1926648 RepID=UPI001123147D|nr:Trp biosynthesis-associated membrane protein [Nocardioides litoris]